MSGGNTWSATGSSCHTKGFSLRTIKYLVLDEADIPHDRRIYLFSATMSNKIEAASKYSTVDTLKQQFRFLPAKYKVSSLVKSFSFRFVGRKQAKWQALYLAIGL